MSSVLCHSCLKIKKNNLYIYVYVFDLFSTCPAMKFLCQQAANEPVNSHPIGLIVILHVINIPVKSLAMPNTADAIKVC
jgi:hypothetical protein